VKHKTTGDKDTTAFGSSSKHIGGATQNVYEAKIIEEECSDWEPMEHARPRREENKSSIKSDSEINDNDWFEVNVSEGPQVDSTPRFDKEFIEDISIMNLPVMGKVETNAAGAISKLLYKYCVKTSLMYWLINNRFLFRWIAELWNY